MRGSRDGWKSRSTAAETGPPGAFHDSHDQRRPVHQSYPWHVRPRGRDAASSASKRDAALHRQPAPGAESQRRPHHDQRNHGLEPAHARGDRPRRGRWPQLLRDLSSPTRPSGGRPSINPSPAPTRPMWSRKPPATLYATSKGKMTRYIDDVKKATRPAARRGKRPQTRPRSGFRRLLHQPAHWQMNNAPVIGIPKPPRHFRTRRPNRHRLRGRAPRSSASSSTSSRC